MTGNALYRRFAMGSIGLLLFQACAGSTAAVAQTPTNRYVQQPTGGFPVAVQVAALSAPPPEPIDWENLGALPEPVLQLDEDIAATLPVVPSNIVDSFRQATPLNRHTGSLPKDVYGHPSATQARAGETDVPSPSLLEGLEASLAQPLLRYPEKRFLSLFEAIHAAIEFAPEIEILRAAVEIQRQEITKEQAQFDWGTFLRSNWDESNRPVGSGLDGAANRSISHSMKNSYGFNKRNLLGGSLQLAQDLGLSDSNSSFFTPQNQATATIALEYQQPLLQGAGRFVNTSRIEIAVASYAAQSESFLAGLQDHVLGVSNAYWDLVDRRGELLIQRNLVAEAIQTAAVVRNRVNVDVGPIQAARTEATVTAREANLADAEFAVVLAQDELLRRIFGARFQDTANSEIITTDHLVGPSRDVDIEFEIEQALQTRAEIRRSLQEIRSAAIERGVAQNQLLPVLGLTLAVSNQGLKGNRGMASALNDQYDLGDPTYGIGLEYLFPVGNRANRSNLRQTEWRLRSFQKQLEEVVSNVVLDVRNASHNLVLRGSQRAMRRTALEQAQRELQITTIRTESLIDGASIGPLYVDTLLSAQDRLAAAEREYVRAITSYARSQIQLQRANGTLLRSAPLPVANGELIAR